MTRNRRSLERGTLGLLGLGVALSCAGCLPAARGPSTEPRSLAEYDLGREAFQGARLREALEHVQKALKFDEENAEAAYLGSIIYLQFCSLDEKSTDCRYPDAEKYARKAMEYGTTSGQTVRDARNVLGVVLTNEGRYDDAIAALKPLANDILFANPEKAWGNLGLAYLRRGNVDEAIDALRRALASEPLFCVGSYRLGLAYEKKGELVLAHESLTRAVETKGPECKRMQEAFDARARIAEKQGLHDEARADLEKCRELNAASPVGHRCAAALQTYQ